MRSNRTVLVVAMATVMMMGCNRDAPPEATPDAPTVETPAAEAPAGPLAAPEVAPAEAMPAAETAPFDVATVAISDAALGEWPYITPAEGYGWSDARTLDLSQVPFWTGQRLQAVEGKVFEARVGAVGEKTYSRFEVLKRFDEALAALGARKITQSEVPSAVIETDLPKNFGSEFYPGSGGYYGNQEVSTYVLRQADKVVWYKLFSDGNGGSVLAAESDAVPAEATPAAQ